VVRYALSQVGKPFDHEALKARLFLSDKFANRDWREPGAWYCAELAARSCEVGGLFNWPLIVIKNRITPSMFLVMLNPLMSNAASFWAPVPDLELMDGEI
jgi:hypothetical protein